MNIEDIKNTIGYVFSKHHKKLFQYQEILKTNTSFHIAWDVENDCELTIERATEITEKYDQFNWFTPTFIK